MEEKSEIAPITRDCYARLSTAHRQKSIKNETWNILYANVRGFKSKIKSINQILLEQQPHLFMITETQLRSNTGISIEGYSFYGRKREGKFSGGVAALVRNDIRSSVAYHESERNIESLWISIRRHNLAPLKIGV